MIKKEPNFLVNFVSLIVTVTTPFLIILTAVRVLLSPQWVQIEYRMPGFPTDPYGFTLDDRLKWSLVSLEYLLNDEGIYFLERQQFDNGESLYNERELKHMEDVKAVVASALLVWWVSIGITLAAGATSKLGDWGMSFRNAMRRGAWLTIGFVGLVIIFVLAAFGVFFVYFHEVFFDPGTWTFSYSDSLIRLFPMRFWQDAFLWIGGLSLLGSLWTISMVRMQDK